MSGPCANRTTIPIGTILMGYQSHKMRILFCRSNTFASWLIRKLTWSDWSHCVILEPDGVHTIEARWPEVRVATLTDVLLEYEVVEIVAMPIANPQAAVSWAWNQVGKPYDWMALFGFIFRPKGDWTDPGKWFCAELVAMAWAHGGSPLVKADLVSRVTPGMLWMLPGGSNGD